jgi:hypothetical protein
MKKVTRTVYLTKESLNLIDKDIGAADKYTIFPFREEGTVSVDMTLDIEEEFRVTEEVLLYIIEGLTPALSEKEHAEKLDKVLVHLRSLGLEV